MLNLKSTDIYYKTWSPVLCKYLPFPSLPFPLLGPTIDSSPVSPDILPLTSCVHIKLNLTEAHFIVLQQMLRHKNLHYVLLRDRSIQKAVSAPAVVTLCLYVLALFNK
jgi:hypothetical protein